MLFSAPQRLCAKIVFQYQNTMLFTMNNRKIILTNAIINKRFRILEVLIRFGNIMSFSILPFLGAKNSK